MLRTRAILALMWVILIISLIYRPSITHKIDTKYFWLLIAMVPAFLMIWGHEAWRRICPLSFFSQLSKYLGLKKTIRLIEKNSFLEKNHLYLQFSFLLIGIILRTLFLNSDRLFLGIFLSLLIVMAIVIGAIFGGKTWCQYICPMAPVQKIYTSPGGLLESSGLEESSPIQKSQCRSIGVKKADVQNSLKEDENACVGCKNFCPDIDLELNYWKEINKPGQSFTYYGYLGIVLGFYFFQRIYMGHWDFVFNGSWTSYNSLNYINQAINIFGNYFIPKWLLSTIVMIGTCIGVVGLLSFVEKKLLKIFFEQEENYKNFNPDQFKHKMFMLVSWLSINLFYFLGQGAFFSFGVLVKNIAFFLVIVVSTLWLRKNWGKTSSLYQKEAMALQLKKKLSIFFPNITELIRGRSIDQLQADEVLLLTQFADQKGKANKNELYRGILRDYLESSNNNLRLVDVELSEIRKKLGISEDVHIDVLHELERDKGPNDQRIIKDYEDSLKFGSFKKALGRFYTSGKLKKEDTLRLAEIFQIPLVDLKRWEEDLLEDYHNTYEQLVKSNDKLLIIEAAHKEIMIKKELENYQLEVISLIYQEEVAALLKEINSLIIKIGPYSEVKMLTRSLVAKYGINKVFGNDYSISPFYLIEAAENIEEAPPFEVPQVSAILKWREMSSLLDFVFDDKNVDKILKVASLIHSQFFISLDVSLLFNLADYASVQNNNLNGFTKNSLEIFTLKHVYGGDEFLAIPMAKLNELGIQGVELDNLWNRSLAISDIVGINKKFNLSVGDVGEIHIIDGKNKFISKLAVLDIKEGEALIEIAASLPTIIKERFIRQTRSLTGSIFIQSQKGQTRGQLFGLYTLIKEIGKNNDERLLKIALTQEFTPSERRRTIRGELGGKVILEQINTQTLLREQFSGEVVNISGGGMLLALKNAEFIQAESGVQVDVKVIIGKVLNFETTAKILRIDKSVLVDGRIVDELALEFVDISANKKEEIISAIYKDLDKNIFENNHSFNYWKKFRKFVVAKKIDEGGSVFSFYLKPLNNMPLPAFYPGQFLTFQYAPHADKSKKEIRCYSLSDSPNEQYYRVSVKKAPNGLISSYWHEQVKEGDLIEVKPPGGDFYLDIYDPRPIILIGGGIGITPVLSMLNYIVDKKLNRNVTLFLGCRFKKEHVFKNHLEEVVKNNPNVKVVVCYSNPEEGDLDGVDYIKKGFVSIDVIKDSLPSLDGHYYLCGPPPFMNSVTNGLYENGVPKSDVRFEAFGPASVSNSEVAVKEDAKIIFEFFGKEASWKKEYKSILECAEDHKMPLKFGCRAGNCRTCVIELKSGEVSLTKKLDKPLEANTCLTCISIPKTDLIMGEEVEEF